MFHPEDPLSEVSGTCRGCIQSLIDCTISAERFLQETREFAAAISMKQRVTGTGASAHDFDDFAEQ